MRVAVNGYGTIGKRVADAVLQQKDMDLAGVTKTRPDFGAKVAESRRIPLYSVFPDRINDFEKRGLSIQGCLGDLISKTDVVVDCTPAGVGRTYRESYARHGSKGIFQGGEEADVAEVTFVAQCNYESAVGKRFVRVASCNTTGLCRTLSTVDRSLGIGEVHASLVRRAVDPFDSTRGPIDAIVPSCSSVPTHHSKDVREVLPHLRILTMAVTVPTKIMHVHMIAARLSREVSRDEAIDVLEATPRTLVLDGRDRLGSTSGVMELGRDLGRRRNDMWETVVWEDTVTTSDHWLCWTQGVHQEAIVIPEVIDAIRAVFDSVDAEASMNMTDRALGIFQSRF